MRLFAMATVFISKFNPEGNETADYVDVKELTKSHKIREELGLC